MLTSEQQNFIIRSMKNNPNFRAFVDGRSELSEESMKDIATWAKWAKPFLQLRFLNLKKSFQGKVSFFLYAIFDVWYPLIPLIRETEVSDSEIRKVKAGKAAAKCGDRGDEFFVIECCSQLVCPIHDAFTAKWGCAGQTTCERSLSVHSPFMSLST